VDTLERCMHGDPTPEAAAWCTFGVDLFPATNPELLEVVSPCMPAHPGHGGGDAKWAYSCAVAESMKKMDGKISDRLSFNYLDLTGLARPFFSGLAVKSLTRLDFRRTTFDSASAGRLVMLVTNNKGMRELDLDDLQGLDKNAVNGLVKAILGLKDLTSLDLRMVDFSEKDGVALAGAFELPRLKYLVIDDISFTDPVCQAFTDTISNMASAGSLSYVAIIDTSCSSAVRDELQAAGRKKGIDFHVPVN